MTDIRELLRRYDEFGFLRKNYDETNPIEKLVKSLGSHEQTAVRKQISLANIESAKDFIVASSFLISPESIEKLFCENISDDKIEINLLTTQGKRKKYLIYQTGEESIKVDNDIFPLEDYKTRARGNFSVDSSYLRDREIKGSQKRKVKSVIEYIPRDRGRLLDFGCGTGCSTIPLAKKFSGKKIFATDFSDEAIRLLNRALIRKGIENVQTCEEDSENLHFRFGERYFGASVGVNAIEEALPWKVFYSLKRITDGPIIIVQDAFDYSQIQKWAGWYGLKIKNSFCIDSPESEKGENEAYVISV